MLAGRCENLMPESTISPSQGLRIWLREAACAPIKSYRKQLFTSKFWRIFTADNEGSMLEKKDHTMKGIMNRVNR
jgi:hypothetical protein